MGPWSVMSKSMGNPMGTGRVQSAGLGGAVKAAGAGKPADVAVFCRQAREYINLLRKHIEKEEHCLFTMADSVLQPEDNEQLSEEFRIADERQAGSSAIEKYRSLADNLARRLGVRRSGLRVSSGCGS